MKQLEESDQPQIFLHNYISDGVENKSEMEAGDNKK